MNIPNLKANLDVGMRSLDASGVRSLLAIIDRQRKELAAREEVDMAAVTWAYVKLLKMDFGPNDADAVVMMDSLKKMIENMPKGQT